MKLIWSKTVAFSFWASNICAYSWSSIHCKEEHFKELENIIDWSEYPDVFNEIDTSHQKRDAESALESILIAVNNSGIIFDILDQIAYNPYRIEMVANITGGLIGNLNSSSLGYILEDHPLNYSKIYTAVEHSGVVKSLLDGVLLDEDYRPNLVRLLTRVINGSKNIFLYVVKDIFKKTKRDDTTKRSTIEILVGNTISAVLGSNIFAEYAQDTLTALNNTQFLTYTVKEFLANEGYQNMTMQVVIDLVRNDNLQLDLQRFNFTNIIDTALDNPDTILKLMNSVLSGELSISGFGEYTDAIRDIISDTEDTGVIALLNKYVFSETHSVTTPLFPTKNIVIPKSTTETIKPTSTLKKNGTSTEASSKSHSSSDASMNSADEVASILSVLNASTQKTTSTQKKTSSSATSFDLSEFLAQLNDATTTSTSSASNSGDNLKSIFALLTESPDNKEAQLSTSKTPSSSSEESKSRSGSSDLAVTKFLIYTQIILIGFIALL